MHGFKSVKLYSYCEVLKSSQAHIDLVMCVSVGLFEYYGASVFHMTYIFMAITCVHCFAFIATSHSLGRAIRHREDYAVIVLADQRYARPSVGSKLPTWISRQLTRLDKFPPAVSTVSKVWCFTSCSVLQFVYFSK